MEIITALAIGGMFGIGIFQLLRRNIIRSTIGLFIIFNAMNLFLLSTGAYMGSTAPYTYSIGQHSDALPQALILTAIVIGMGGFSLVLAMTYILSVRYKTGDVDEINKLQK